MLQDDRSDSTGRMRWAAIIHELRRKSLPCAEIRWKTL